MGTFKNVLTLIFHSLVLKVVNCANDSINDHVEGIICGKDFSIHHVTNFVDDVPVDQVVSLIIVSINDVRFISIRLMNCRVLLKGVVYHSIISATITMGFYVIISVVTKPVN